MADDRDRRTTREWELERGEVLTEIRHTSTLVSRLDVKLDEKVDGLNQKIDETSKDFFREIAKVNTRLAVQEVKSGVWGGLAGLITALMLWLATMWGKDWGAR